MSVRRFENKGRGLVRARLHNRARQNKDNFSQVCSDDDGDLVAATLMSTTTIPASTSASHPSEDQAVPPAPPPPTATRYVTTAPCATESKWGKSWPWTGWGREGGRIVPSWAESFGALETPNGQLFKLKPCLKETNTNESEPCSPREH